jgi:DNA-binding CsgD family transcriptional regulator
MSSKSPPTINEHVQRFQALSLELHMQLERLSSIAAGLRAEVHPLPDSLERLLDIPTDDARKALAIASDVIAQALGCEKVDVFFKDPSTSCLVAVGTSNTPLGKLQKSLGLDRLPLDSGGRIVSAFRSGAASISGDLERDPEERPDLPEKLGVRSALIVPFALSGGGRAILVAASTQINRFDEREMRFMAAAAHWVALVANRVQDNESNGAGHADTEDRARESKRLTARQREIALLVARGFSNNEIARELVVTPGTVANHIAQMLRRLDFASRTQIAVWAVENLAEGFRPPRTIS